MSSGLSSAVKRVQLDFGQHLAGLRPTGQACLAGLGRRPPAGLTYAVRGSACSVQKRAQCALTSPACDLEPRKRPGIRERRPKADAHSQCGRKQQWAYILFLLQVLLISSHVPPSLTQSCSLFASFTSPAKTGPVKAGPVKASARVKAKIERRVFMAVSPLRWT